ncbi:Foldase protein PrsA precursor [Novipirellula galeiformis]|uniref:Foldase protein PrsA n=1 Tax=Novipirellula galeiformis TaxID=2528004 RepID=A0A5C6C877_9BACT|nr:peptidylprolyl isomerase [Novipirellula galeiformis]TWU20227.1 Foldase protein PrsA precursor [Novipirellula galeiformis]
MIQLKRWGCVFLLLKVLFSADSFGEEKWKPEDPFAAIDGQPIFLGELNLVLIERFGVNQFNRIDVRVQQATASLLVRRHLALRSLHDQGGDALTLLVDRQMESLQRELKRRGSDLHQYAKERYSTEKSVRDDLDFKVSWGHFVKSRLTEANLRRFFENRKSHYGGGRWEVSQIFVAADSSDPDQVDSIRHRLSDLVKGIRDASDVGLAFAAAARDHSNSVSAGDGGRLGWVTKEGDLPASVMQVVRNTETGAVSDPVQSPLGMHVVFVHRFEEMPIAFETLSDIAPLRRDATKALLEKLVQSQSQAKVDWFIEALQPPEGSRPSLDSGAVDHEE